MGASRVLSFREQTTIEASFQVMPDYRICLITQDNHIASTPVTIVCDDDKTAVQHSQKLLDRNDIQLWQGRRMVTRLKAKLVA
jgi:hypothetical protein